MKNYPIRLAAVFFLFTFILSASVATFGQGNGIAIGVRRELRPFDFSDKYYTQNGVQAFALIGRKNGTDGKSVFGFTRDPNHNNVRITETWPGYAPDGSTLFWNYYGGFNKQHFTRDAAGRAAADLAFMYPMYVFPSETLKGEDRQAALLRIDNDYFAKNPIGIAAVITVRFTDLINTESGQRVVKFLTARNGSTTDGTPIIRTFTEVSELATKGYVELEQPSPDIGSERPSFAVSKVIRFPQSGAIAPDAFLEYTKNSDGKSLADEVHFLLTFECHQQGDAVCF